MDTASAVKLLRTACAGYEFEPVAIYKMSGDHGWPLTAANEAELASKLSDGDHWRKHDWKIGKAVKKQLEKLLAAAAL